MRDWQRLRHRKAQSHLIIREQRRAFPQTAPATQSFGPITLIPRFRQFCALSAPAISPASFTIAIRRLTTATISGPGLKVRFQPLRTAKSTLEQERESAP